MSAQQQYSLALFACSFDMFQAVKGAECINVTAVCPVGKGGFDEAHADGVITAVYQLLLLLWVQLGKTQADIGAYNRASITAKQPEKPAQSTPDGKLQAQG